MIKEHFPLIVIQLDSVNAKRASMAPSVMNVPLDSQEIIATPVISDTLTILIAKVCLTFDF